MVGWLFHSKESLPNPNAGEEAGCVLKPSEFGEAMADILTQTCKRCFRDEPLTWSELDTMQDRISLFIEDEKSKVDERHIDRAEQELDKRKEGL
jgi:hypothetical protein